MAPNPTASDEAKRRAEALVGQTLDGRYRVDDIIAMGAMGTVYLARHLKLKKRVALKVLHPDVEDHPELIARFEREAQAGARVTHPHVAAATDFGELDDGTKYLVMEYVKGTALRGVLDTQAPLAPLRAVRIARQLAVALGEIHAKGIVHRDLKPRNVMLSGEDFVKIVDFGLSKLDSGRDSTHDASDAEDDGGRITGKGMVFGTVDYMAPEAAFGMECVDARSDLYALGVVLYEMLAGKHPYDGTTNLEVWTKMRHEELPLLRNRAPNVDVDPKLEAVVRKLLEKDFEERYQTAAEVIDALDAVEPAGKIAPTEPRELMRSLPPPSSGVIPAAPPSGSKSQEATTSGASVLAAVPKPHPVSPKSTHYGWFLVAAAVGAGAVWFLLRDVGGGVAVDPAGVASSEVARTTPPPPDEVSAAPEPPSSAEEPAPTLIDLDEPEAEGSAAAAPPASLAPSSSAVPDASASAAPAASMRAAAGPPPSPARLAKLRAAVLLATNAGTWDEAADAVKALLPVDPEALRDPGRERTFGELLQAIDRARHARSDEVWRAVAMAPGGADLLYRFAESGGKSAWANKARSLLRDPEVLASATPAVRIAWQLRDADCSAKLDLLDRAVAEGDERALVALQIAKACFKKSHSVDKASKKLRERLEKESKAR